MSHSDITKHVSDLHTKAVDSRDGYNEALEEAGKKGLTGLFSKMAALHERHEIDLSNLLRSRGLTANNDGSVIGTINKTIMDIRGLFGKLDQSVIPGLIDGEERNLKRYKEALDDVSADPEVSKLLFAHLAEISEAIAAMRTMKH